MSKYPYTKIVLPKEVEKVGNGKLTDKMLKGVKTGGKMWVVAADAFNEMYDAAMAAGFKLRNVGDFRPFEDQLAMFKDRYSEKPTGRKPEVTREYDGKKWYLKEGKAPSSTPGKSNHGFGLAIDLGYEDKGKLVSMGGKCLDWMCENAPKYGFYLQGDDPSSPEFEAWHWQYCLGDKPRAGAAAAPAAATAAAPASNVAYPGAPVQKGATGDVVKAIQQKLGVAVTGTFDDATEKAVKTYKNSNGFQNDGIVGPKVWEKLFG